MTNIMRIIILYMQIYLFANKGFTPMTAYSHIVRSLNNASFSSNPRVIRHQPPISYELIFY